MNIRAYAKARALNAKVKPSNTTSRPDTDKANAKKWPQGQDQELTSMEMPEMPNISGC